MRTREAQLAAASSCCNHFEESDFATHAGFYDRPNTIQHWQLRDLVSCSADGRHLYTVCGHSTYSYEIATGESTQLQELRFKVMALAVGAGYVAAAGSESQLDVRRLSPSQHSTDGSRSSGDGEHSGGHSGGGSERGPLFSGPIGGSVNNALHISGGSEDSVQLYVCNNDDTIKVFLLPSMQRVDLLCCPAAINYCSVNVQLDMLAAVGDSRNVYLYQRRPSGFVRSGTYSLAQDAGMCTAWAPSGHVFASASQCGLVCVWDVRSPQAVAKIHATQACRNVKFSSSPVDVLAFSEHTGRVQLLDSRCYGSKQRLLSNPGVHPGRHISGLAFSPSGAELYAGIEDAGIAHFNINTVARRTSGCGEYM